MASITKGYKFRVYPNKVQRDLLARSFGSNRFVWNKCLGLSIEAYEAWKDDDTLPRPGVGFNSFNQYLNTLKAEYEWLHEISSVSLQQTTRDLAQAFTNFFRELKKGKVAYPRFKKKGNRNAIRLTKSGFTLRDGKLRIAKCKDPVNVKWSRDLPSEPSSCTVSQDPDGRYYVSFICETDPVLTNGVEQTGIDLGLTHLGVTNHGARIDNPKYLIKSQKYLKRYQRQLAKKKLGSKNRNKARLRVARLHKKISNQRNDYLHKVSRALVNENQVLALETLKVSNMVKNRNLAKGISDVSWSTLTRFILYKAKESHHCNAFLMHPFFASTHICSTCDTKREEKLSLGTRRWVCSSCSTEHDRDINAAKNILAKALAVNREHNPNNVWIPEPVVCDI